MKKNKTKNEKIAIIVPIYNVEKYVEKCLNSLCSQTYSEIIIYAVIDGSPDNSAAIVKKMAKKDKRIVCIEKENGGYGSVLEYVINSIDQNYFIICDPDDWLETDAVETLYNVVNKYDLDLAVGDKFLVYSDNNKEEYSCSDKNHCLIPNKVYEEKEIGKFSFLQVSPHAKMYKTSILKNIKIPHKVSYTDYFLYFYALSKSHKVMYINKPLAFYLIDRVGNTATDKSAKSFHSHVVVWEHTFNVVKNCGNEYMLLSLYNGLKGLYIYYAKIRKEIKNEDYEKIILFRHEMRKFKHEILTIKKLSLRKKIEIRTMFSKILTDKIIFKILEKIV